MVHEVSKLVHCEKIHDLKLEWLFVKKASFREILLHSYEKENQEIIRRTNSVSLKLPDKFQWNIIYILKLQLELTKIDGSLK